MGVGPLSGQYEDPQETEEWERSKADTKQPDLVKQSQASLDRVAKLQAIVHERRAQLANVMQARKAHPAFFKQGGHRG